MQLHCLDDLVVTILAKDQRPLHAASDRFGDGERAVDGQLTRRRREDQPDGVGADVDRRVGVGQRRHATDLDEEGRAKSVTAHQWDRGVATHDVRDINGGDEGLPDQYRVEARMAACATSSEYQGPTHRP